MKNILMISVIALAISLTACVNQSKEKSHYSKVKSPSQEVARAATIAMSYSEERDTSIIQTYPVINSEKYINFDENGIKLVRHHPVSTFSVDVDTASYSNVRRMLEGEGRFATKGCC